MKVCSHSRPKEKFLGDFFQKVASLAPAGASAFLFRNRLRFHFSFAPFVSKKSTDREISPRARVDKGYAPLTGAHCRGGLKGYCANTPPNINLFKGAVYLTRQPLSLLGRVELNFKPNSIQKQRCGEISFGGVGEDSYHPLALAKLFGKLYCRRNVCSA